MPLSLIGLVGTLVILLGLLGSIAYLKSQVTMYSSDCRTKLALIKTWAETVR